MLCQLEVYSNSADLLIQSEYQAWLCGRETGIFGGVRQRLCEEIARLNHPELKRQVAIIVKGFGTLVMKFIRRK